MAQKSDTKFAGGRPAAGRAAGAKRAVGSWGEREAGILRVARELFIRNGYESTSMASVAAAAGLSEGTLYNYFSNKTDLVLRVTLANLELRAEAAARAVDEAESLREGFEKLIALHLASIIQDEEVYRIWLREVRGVKSYRQSASRDALARFANQFVRLLARFGHDEDAPGRPTRAMMREMIFGGSEHIGFTAMVQRRADKIDVDATAAQMADVYLRGFGFEG